MKTNLIILSLLLIFPFVSLGHGLTKSKLKKILLCTTFEIKESLSSMDSLNPVTIRKIKNKRDRFETNLLEYEKKSLVSYKRIKSLRDFLKQVDLYLNQIEIISQQMHFVSPIRSSYLKHFKYSSSTYNVLREPEPSNRNLLLQGILEELNKNRKSHNDYINYYDHFKKLLIQNTNYQYQQQITIQKSEVLDAIYQIQLALRRHYKRHIKNH